MSDSTERFFICLTYDGGKVPVQDRSLIPLRGLLVPADTYGLTNSMRRVPIRQGTEDKMSKVEDVLISVLEKNLHDMVWLTLSP